MCFASGDQPDVRLELFFGEAEVVTGFEEEHLDGRLVPEVMQQHRDHSQYQLERVERIGAGGVLDFAFADSDDLERAEETIVIGERLRFAEPDDDVVRGLTIHRSLQDSFGDDLANVIDYHELMIGAARVVAPGRAMA
jgi:hypothetical protein